MRDTAAISFQFHFKRCRTILLCSILGTGTSDTIDFNQRFPPTQSYMYRCRYFDLVDFESAIASSGPADQRTHRHLQTQTQTHTGKHNLPKHIHPIYLWMCLGRGSYILQGAFKPSAR
ncbi:hypothetical protein F4779DRAFT_303275 [Xylariaceae sp. FL0662B]|nr:hypothetical protein F4779DRAFT_303275 [Xylariaceae sp. FL0662B]